ncbi:topoisomerase DNA-binding C4 zinc finger domain-containing protein [Paraglaciecola aestuariivivens]
MVKIDNSLFSSHEHNALEDFGPCPKCHGKLSIRRGKSGAFIGCNQYPECDYSKPLHEYENTEVKVIEGSHCPLCQAQLVIKKGRYGLFIGCSDFPECTYIQSQKANTEATVECPKCKNGQLVKRANKYGKNFYPCDNYPKCDYALNFAPISRVCPQCEWPVMLQKVSAKGPILQCPVRKCQHKMKLD